MSDARRIRLVLSGANGRMGHAIALLAAGAPDIELAGGLGRTAGAHRPGISGLADAGALVADADVVLDVSAPAFLEELLNRHGPALAGRALVVGTTGIEDPLETRLDTLARSCALLIAANFSVGVNLLLGLVERAARALPARDFDVEIVEAHHRNKVDAPSGTALALGRSIAQGRGADRTALRRDGRAGRTAERPVGEIGFHALRGGGVIGEHRVHFLGACERLEIAHQAMDRALFAEGALAAVRWIAGRPPGRYGMNDVLGI